MYKITVTYAESKGAVTSCLSLSCELPIVPRIGDRIGMEGYDLVVNEVLLRNGSSSIICECAYVPLSAYAQCMHDEREERRNANKAVE